MVVRLPKPRPRRSSDRENTSTLPLAARRHPIVRVIERNLDECGVLKRRSTPSVVLAVSGGADSVALLLACHIIASRRTARTPQLKLTVAHVHHHLRASARLDAAFVQRLCKRLNVTCTVHHVHPSRMNGNVSAHARSLRYAALVRQARTCASRWVLTAHHAEDQFETMLMAFCRGAGLDGLAGMPAVRALDERIQLVRPMLEISKADCTSLCLAAGVRWREDPSNRDLTKARARIRREVVPVLEELWPGCAKRATAAAEVIRDVAAVLNAAVEKNFGTTGVRSWPRATLRALPVAVVSAGIRRAAVHLVPSIADDLTREHVLTAAELIKSDERAPKEYDWPGRLKILVNSNAVGISKSRHPRRFKPRINKRVSDE